MDNIMNTDERAALVGRVREAMEETITALCAEVERLARERDAAVAQVETTRTVWERQARQYNDERYEASAEVLRLTAEVERLERENANLMNRIDDDKNAFVAVSVRCLNTGVVPKDALSVMDAVTAVCDEVERLARERDALLLESSEAHDLLERMTDEVERLERLIVRNMDPFNATPSDGAEMMRLHAKHHPENYAAMTGGTDA